MADNRDTLLENVVASDRGSKSTKVGKEYIKNEYTDHEAHVGDLHSEHGIDLRNAEVTDHEFNNLLAEHEMLKTEEKYNGKYETEYSKEALDDSKERFKDSVSDYKDQFEAKFEALEEGKSKLKEIHAEHKQEVGELFTKEEASLRKAIQEAQEASKSAGSPQAVIWEDSKGTLVDDTLSIKEAQTELSEMSARRVDAIKKLDTRLEEEMKNYGKVEKKLVNAAEKFEKKSGVNLMEGVRKNVSKAETTVAHSAEHAVETAAKGASGFAKIGSTGVGALVGGWIGHRFDGEGQNTGTGVGALLGGAGGYAASAKLFAKEAAKVAPHVHM